MGIQTKINDNNSTSFEKLYGIVEPSSNNNNNNKVVSNNFTNPSNSSNTEYFDFNQDFFGKNSGSIITQTSELEKIYASLYENFDEEQKEEAAKIDSSINMLEKSKSELESQIKQKEYELLLVNGDINIALKEIREAFKNFPHTFKIPDSFEDPIPSSWYFMSMEGGEDLFKKYIDLKNQQDELNKEILEKKASITSIEAAQQELFYDKIKLDKKYYYNKELDLTGIPLVMQQDMIKYDYDDFLNDLNVEMPAALSELNDSKDKLNELLKKYGMDANVDGSSKYVQYDLFHADLMQAIYKYNDAYEKVDNLNKIMKPTMSLINSSGILGLYMFDKDVENFDILKYINGDELAFLLYLNNNYGPSAAKEYVNSLLGDINKIRGQEEAQKLINELDLTDEGKVKECLKNFGLLAEDGFTDGINNFVAGLKNTISADGKISVDDYKVLYFLQYLQENAPQYYSLVYQESSSIGNMAPSITAGFLVSILGAPELAPTVASFLMGTSAGGNAREHALQMGADEVSSILYGCLIGASEAYLGEFLGNIPGISKASSFTIAGFLKEGGEEFLQEYVDAFAQYTVLGQNINLDEVNENATNAFIMGAFTSFLLNGTQNTLSLTLNGVDYVFNRAQVSSYLNQASIYLENNSDVSDSKLTELLTGAKEYEYKDSTGKTINLTSIQIEDMIVNHSEQKFDKNFYPFLQRYIIDNPNISSELLSDYKQLLVDNGIEVAELSSLSTDGIMSYVGLSGTSYDQFVNHFSNLSDMEIVDELTSIHTLYSEIYEGKYIVSPDVLEKIRTLNLLYIESAINIGMKLEYNDYVLHAKHKLSEVDPQLVSLYENARNAGKLDGFKGYEEHNFVHVLRVAEESESVVNLFNQIVKNNDSGTFGEIDPQIVYLAGLFHDAGMSEGGRMPSYVPVSDKLYDSVTDIPQLNVDERISVIKVNKTTKYQIVKLDSNNPFVSIASGDSKKIRSQHPFNSARISLQNSDILGENTEMIAFLTFLHSKSSSGVRDLTSSAQLHDSLVQLTAMAKEEGLNFDISKFIELNPDGTPKTIEVYVNGYSEIVDANEAGAVKKEIYVFKPEVEKQLRTGAAALRVGDCHAKKTSSNHAGESITVLSSEHLTSNEYDKLFSKNDAIKIDDLCKSEAMLAHVSIGDIEISNDNSDLFFSKRIIIGEQNTVMKETKTVEIDGEPTMVYTIQVKSDSAPACTWEHSIMEKLGEYKTYSKAEGISQRYVIELPKDISPEVREFYSRMVEDYNHSVEIEAGSTGRPWIKMEIGGE